jgi:hypothetical protein
VAIQETNDNEAGMQKTVIEVLNHTIVVEGERGQGSAAISSDLYDGAAQDEEECAAAVDAVERMILAHHCAGLDVNDPRYIEGLRTALETLSDIY